MDNPWEPLRKKLQGEFPAGDRGRKAEFIRATGITRVTIDRWLRGDTSPKLEELGRIAVWFGRKPWELIKPEDAPANPLRARVLAKLEALPDHNWASVEALVDGLILQNQPAAAGAKKPRSDLSR